MRISTKQGALALALLGGAALFSGPAIANSIHDEGDFGGGYLIIGPGGPERHHYLRHHVFRPNDEARPIYSFSYGPATGFYDVYGPVVVY
ncbi:hypothetical protein [Methyloceanibacter sp.]|uniref:hypothetical protein n=1 Tax=Methyloceanibacter sp. TaxID=1965321 RepID=UPI002D4BAB52|nr:hypothetical protein [Methyloceanibacter sp.]HZP07915.1 hypothetical protein [Methyloceanibacter sp.]